MAVLNRSTLATAKVRAEFKLDAAAGKAPVRILQIGDGNFLRGFADWLIDVTNGAGLFNGRVTIAQPLARGIADLINAQDGLFTVLLRGVQGGQTVDSRRIVSCVDKCLNPYAQWDEMIALAEDPSLRFVISNTTEAGIAYVAEAQSNACPDNFPAKVASLLWARFQKLGGSASTGLVFLPCELIEANGSKLRSTVLQHAQAWGLPAAFVEWVNAHNHFCNTLVDRIVPGYPAAEAEALCTELGYTDKLLVAAEPFLLWVIEGPAHLAEEIPLHKAGLDVVWTDDLQPYRTRKVRILNGAHTASSLASYCAGLDTVQQMTEDPVVSKYLKQVMFEEIVPFVPLPDAERKAYADTIMERFANPHIRHELISIALNSVSKWQVRVLPTVKDFAKAHGKAPAGLAFSLAALLNFYHGQFDAQGEFVGQREAGNYPIRDNADVLAALAEAWRGWQAGEALSARVHSMLGDVRLWGEDLNAVAGLTDQVVAALTAIKARGVKAAMAELA
ncbi:tagaturonate reductase [Uliginosibacterium sp. 31-16]|uniref:tagaturonate reductase n=1 Tax=Uliginosibacterium sp. 31-16 TaxID=3068315 RepID=UPI00273D6B70|nr:tagaturonate reductase [Uliginosibacterium sp. 31-16]MDP5240758.1 tagaturonate reductase [Uliginosibacterium sp. 31-16]